MNTTLPIKSAPTCKIVDLARAICCIAVLFGTVAVGAGQTSAPISSAKDAQKGSLASESAQPQAEPKIQHAQLEALVGPIALYPDPLLAQLLAASTYPLEIIKLKQWLDRNKNLKGKALADAVAQQNWDPSIQALAAFPGIVDKLANDIEWTTDLGNAFLAQESDLMEAVQALRANAQANGVLKTNNKQTVATEETKSGKEAITIEPAQHDIVYVPNYNTQDVYRDAAYSDSGSDYSGYSGSSDDGYSYLGYAVAAAYGYYWGRYNWREGYTDVNRDNYYVKNYNKWNTNVSNRSEWNRNSQRLSEAGGRWQHDPSHRGNAPYEDNLANRFGQANNRLSGSQLNARASQFAKSGGLTESARSNLSRASGTARSPNAGSFNRIGSRVPNDFPRGTRGGAFNAPRGDFARASSLRGADSLRPPGDFRGGPPGGFHGGPPPGLHAGPGMGGPPVGGPPMGGGMPMGAPPPPPHP